jgi:hypothetical protein
MDESFDFDIEYWEHSVGYKEYETYYTTTGNKLKTDSSFALQYAFSNGPIPEEFETVFLNSAEHAYQYSVFVLKNKLSSKLEKVFEKDPAMAFIYGSKYYKNKFPTKLEKSFRLKTKFAYMYAVYLNKRLNPILEKTFIKDTKNELGEDDREDFSFAYNYSKYILKGKFSQDIHKALYLRYTFDNNCDKNNLKKYFEENY